MKAQHNVAYYRTLILSIGMFLALDFGVLLLNLYIASEISTDAVAVNLAGRQRMLTQKLTKALFEIQQTQAAHTPVTAPLVEFRGAVRLFNQTLQAFSQGGTVAGGNGSPVLLAAVSDARGRRILATSAALWHPLVSLTRSLRERPDGSVSVDALGTTLHYAEAHNGQLLQLMNALTTRMQHIAGSKASRLRLVQFSAMGLALANFIFILVHFVSQLAQRDSAIEIYERGLENLLAAKEEELKAAARRYRQAMNGEVPKVTPEEQSRRRRAVHDALVAFRKQTRHVSLEQIMELMWLWQDEYNESEQIVLFDFAREASRRLRLYDLRQRLHMELVRTMAAAPEMLGPDPIGGMRAVRPEGLEGTATAPFITGVNGFDLVLQQLFDRLEALDRGKVIDVRMEFATQLHRLPIDRRLASELREFCAHRGRRHILAEADASTAGLVLKALWSSCQRVFGAQVVGNVFKQSASRLQVIAGTDGIRTVMEALVAG